MTDIKQSIRRPIIALALPKSTPALMSYAEGVVKRMTGNPALPNPTPPLPAITAAINDLRSAQTDTLSRVKGGVAVRDQKRTALVSLLQQLRAHIQATADADPTNATSIIENSGVAVRKTPTRVARTFTAKSGPVSGVVKVVAQAAARRASYDWEYSSDGGRTWISTPPTLQAKTTVAGLQPGLTVQFKYRAVTKNGPGDWSQPVSLMVH